MSTVRYGTVTVYSTGVPRFREKDDRYHGTRILYDTILYE